MPRSASATRAKSPVVPGPRRRVSHELEQCGGGYLLSLEDDAPVAGRTRRVPREHHRTRAGSGAARISRRSTAIRATVGQIPFNFQIGKDAAKIPLPKPSDAATASSRSASTTARARRSRRASLEPARVQHGLTPLPPIAARQAEGHARPLLPVHARQGRSDLGHRRHRARRTLTCLRTSLRHSPAGARRSMRCRTRPSRKRMLGDGVAHRSDGQRAARALRRRGHFHRRRAPRASRCARPAARRS